MLGSRRFHHIGERVSGVLFGQVFGASGGAGGVGLVGASVAGSTTVHWQIGYDGFTYTQIDAGGFTQSADWISPQSGMDLYEVRATKFSGTTPSGILGAWLPMSSSHTWGLSSAHEKNCFLTIELRRASDGVVVAATSVELDVAGLD
jgi:hypothetical protein